MRLTWSPQARADLAAFHGYYSDSAPDLAAKATGLAVAAARLLAKHPNLGPVIEDSDYRKWRVPTTNHILIYRVDAEGLRIGRFVHSAQNWQKFL